MVKADGRGVRRERGGLGVHLVHLQVGGAVGFGDGFGQGHGERGCVNAAVRERGGGRGRAAGVEGVGLGLGAARRTAPGEGDVEFGRGHRAGGGVELVGGRDVLARGKLGLLAGHIEKHVAGAGPRLGRGDGEGLRDLARPAGGIDVAVDLEGAGGDGRGINLEPHVLHVQAAVRDGDGGGATWPGKGDLGVDGPVGRVLAVEEADGFGLGGVTGVVGVGHDQLHRHEGQGHGRRSRVDDVHRVRGGHQGIEVIGRDRGAIDDKGRQVVGQVGGEVEGGVGRASRAAVNGRRHVQQVVQGRGHGIAFV